MKSESASYRHGMPFALPDVPYSWFQSWRKDRYVQSDALRRADALARAGLPAATMTDHYPG
jgi:hypothetical protein